MLGVAIAGNFGFSALIFFTALYLQDQLDLAPLPAGLVMIAFSACFVVTLPRGTVNASEAMATSGEIPARTR